MNSCSPLQVLQWPLVLLITVVLLIMSYYYRSLGWRLYTLLGAFGAGACITLTYAFNKLAILAYDSSVEISHVDSPFGPASVECFESSMKLSALPSLILVVTYVYHFFRRRNRRKKSRAHS